MPRLGKGWQSCYQNVSLESCGSAKNNWLPELNHGGLGGGDAQNPIDSITWLVTCDMSHQEEWHSLKKPETNFNLSEQHHTWINITSPYVEASSHICLGTRFSAKNQKTGNRTSQALPQMRANRRIDTQQFLAVHSTFFVPGETRGGKSLRLQLMTRLLSRSIVLLLCVQRIVR